MSDITLITVTDLVLVAFLAGAPGLLVGVFLVGQIIKLCQQVTPEF